MSDFVMPVVQWFRIGDHKMPVPTPANAGDYGYDIAVREETLVHSGQVQRAGIGFALASPLPPNVCVWLVPRSSLRDKFKMTIPNSPGLVDGFYGDELKVQLENVSDAAQHLLPGTRVAQLVFMPVLKPSSVEVFQQDPRMTRGGFGSTG